MDSLEQGLLVTERMDATRYLTTLQEIGMVAGWREREEEDSVLDPIIVVRLSDGQVRPFHEWFEAYSWAMGAIDGDSFRRSSDARSAAS